MPILSPYLRDRRTRQVIPYLEGDVLDFGCGYGTLSTASERYVGVDIDPDVLAHASATHPNAEFLSIDEVSGTFDTICLIAVVEHLHDPASTLKTLVEHLKPKGRIVVTTPHPSWEWMHDLGSRFGLVARSAHHAHVSLLDRDGLLETGEEAGLTMVEYRRFLLGLNQLVVFTHI